MCELEAAYPSITHTDDPELLRGVEPRGWSPIRRTHLTSTGTSSLPTLSRSASTNAGSSPTHFLLYLNFDTFVGQDGARLADEVRAAMAAKLPFVMPHENDPTKGGCQVLAILTILTILTIPTILTILRYTDLLILIYLLLLTLRIYTYSKHISLQFERFFTTTPTDMIQAGLFKQVDKLHSQTRHSPSSFFFCR